MTKSLPSLRIHQTRHPLLYEVNTRVLLTELSRSAGSRVTLGTIPDRLLDDWASLGFDAIWLMGVWKTGRIGLEIATTHSDLAAEYRKVLPDFTTADVGGSPYSISAYEVSTELGGEKELARLRKRLAERGLGLVLDFVCNHTARDHAWTKEHPEYYIQGSPELLEQEPWAWFEVSTKKGKAVLALGRDPMFPPWTDTAQINHMHAGAREALVSVLRQIAGLCDGVRCDMAMLMLRGVFLVTWDKKVMSEEGGVLQTEFWGDAITNVRKSRPDFLFVAEAYWDLEWALQQLGFDYTYDKRLYDRLRYEGAVSVRNHLKAEMTFQTHSLRFIENHDEPRAAMAFSSEAWHSAAAVVTLTVPGMAMLHDGQMDGRAVKVPVQLSRRPQEAVSEQIRRFYRRLLVCLGDASFRQGDWRMLSVRPAWHDNPTWENYLAYCWQRGDVCERIVVVNYAPHSGQCYIDLPMAEVDGPALEFRDLMSDAAYVRERSSLESKGMYFDLPGYGFHIFALSSAR